MQAAPSADYSNAGTARPAEWVVLVTAALGTMLTPLNSTMDFWSVILYDTQTRSMLQTGQQFPMVSSQVPGLEVNADSSVGVSFGPQPPVGKEHNWVQTIPGKGWSIMLRLYGPWSPGSTRRGGQGRSNRSRKATSVDARKGLGSGTGQSVLAGVAATD
jgi:hypothetical protein